MTHDERLAKAIDLNRAIVSGKTAGQIATRDLRGRWSDRTGKAGVV